MKLSIKQFRTSSFEPDSFASVFDLFIIVGSLPISAAVTRALHASRVVGSSGLEPPTSRLSGARSNQLSYEPILVSCVLSTFGGDDGIRTHDPLLAGQVLSQLSYTPIGFWASGPFDRLFPTGQGSVLALTYLPAPSPVKYCRHCTA